MQTLECSKAHRPCAAGDIAAGARDRPVRGSLVDRRDRVVQARERNLATQVHTVAGLEALALSVSAIVRVDGLEFEGGGRGMRTAGCLCCRMTPPSWCVRARKTKEKLRF